MACLDTNVLIDLSGARVAAGRRRPGPPSAAGSLPVTSLPRRASTTPNFEWELSVQHKRAAEEARVSVVLNAIVILELDCAGADRFGEIMARQLSAGKPIGDADALIAAITMSHGQTVLTQNTRHFEKIPGLAVESY